MVKKVVTEKFVAFDGSTHDTIDAAKLHEATGFLKHFQMLQPAKVQAAFDGETEEGKKLAANFERFGIILRERRYDRGEKDMSRRPAKTADAPVIEGQAGQVAAE